MKNLNNQETRKLNNKNSKKHPCKQKRKIKKKIKIKKKMMMILWQVLKRIIMMKISILGMKKKGRRKIIKNKIKD